MSPAYQGFTVPDVPTASSNVRVNENHLPEGCLIPGNVFRLAGINPGFVQ
jgi:hypothetical protein